jgi:hypothetical protein
MGAPILEDRKIKTLSWKSGSLSWKLGLLSWKLGLLSWKPEQLLPGSSGFHDRLAGTTHSQTMKGIARRTASAAKIQETMALPTKTSRDRRLYLKKLTENSTRFVSRLRETVKRYPGVPCKCVGRCWRATAGSCRCGKEVQAGGVHAFLTYNRNVTFALAQVTSKLPWQRRLRACRSSTKHGLRG